MVFPLVFCLRLKSFQTEDDFFPIFRPKNARATDYTVGTLLTGATFRGLAPRSWRSGKEIPLKGLLGNSSSYVT